jgi:hypothetical protein
MTVNQLVLFTPGVRVIEHSSRLLFMADVGEFEGQIFYCEKESEEKFSERLATVASRREANFFKEQAEIADKEEKEHKEYLERYYEAGGR